MTDIAIRPAAEADYDRLSQIWIEGQVPLDGSGDAPPAGLYDELRARLPREVASGAWQVFAAETSDGIAGLLAINVREGVLNQLFVTTVSRSRGIGKAMLDFAKARMPDGFWLRTHSLNVRGHRFYEREGLAYLRTEPHPRHPEAMFRIYAWSPAAIAAQSDLTMTGR